MNYVICCATFLILATVRQCSTAPRTASPETYIDWVEGPDNGLHLSKQVGRLTFELQYKPLEYVVLKDHPGETLSSAQLTQEKSGLSDMQYFTFRIADEKAGDLLRNDASTAEMFSQRLHYFSSAMQNDLHLIEGNDTLPCLLFHFERTYGIDPRSTFVAGFPVGKGSATQDKTFFFDDHELDAGPVYITISKEAIQQTPDLNLE